jgi:hypothetical protein
MTTRAPAAIRIDHDPLPAKVTAWVGYPRSTVSPLALFRWTEFRCPHCREVFRRDYLPHKIRLGSGERTCEHCGKIFDDGSREWPELPANEKFRCILPPPLVGVTIGLLICIVLTVIFASRERADFVGVVAVVSVFLLPVVPWFAIRIPQIYRSIYRYENEISPTRQNRGIVNSGEHS